MIAVVTMVPSASQDLIGNQDTRNQVVAAWRLAWLEEEGADGKVQKADCTLYAGAHIDSGDENFSVTSTISNLRCR